MTPATTTRPAFGRPRMRGAVDRRIAPRNLSDVALLTRAIAETKAADGVSPITDRDFAAAVLRCHDRTLRKYLNGAPLPALAREKLVELLDGK